MVFVDVCRVRTTQGGMKFLIKVPDQVAFAILSSWYYRSYLTECLVAVKKSANMNSTTGNGSIESSIGSCFSTTAYKIGQTIALSLMIAVSMTANSFIVLIFYKTPTLRKPINYFIANMAMSDLLYSIFWPPTLLSLIHRTDLWLIGGQFGQALCKLVPFFAEVSTKVSIQNLVLIAVDRFVAVVFPLRSPVIRSKLCPFFILGTWIASAAVCSPYLFTF